MKFTRWRLDLQKAWNTFENMMGEINPQFAGGIKMMLDLAGKDKDPDFDLRKSLIANLGDDIISYQKPPRGQTLGAVQELVRTAVQRRSRGRAGRIVIDISGYRQARRTALERFVSQVAEQVKSSGVARVLEAMPPADRKVVHDAINGIDGVTTSSEGEEPSRRVVISPVGS